MRKLIHCPCGCGELRRAPLPPLAERMRRRRFNAEQVAKARAVLEGQLQAYRTHVLGLDRPAAQQETRH